MKASKMFKYALAITYGVYMGKFLGDVTGAFCGGLVKAMRSDKDKSETK